MLCLRIVQLFVLRVRVCVCDFPSKAFASFISPSLMAKDAARLINELDWNYVCDLLAAV